MREKIFRFLVMGVLLFNVIGCEKSEQLDDNQVKEQEIQKINLNDTIEVSLMTVSTGSSDCFFYMFPINLQEVFPNAQIKSSDSYKYVSYWSGEERDAVDGEISEEGLTNKIDSLNFDIEQEETLTKLFEEYKSSSVTGLKDVLYSLENHRFSFSYEYLVFKNNNYESQGAIFNEQVNKILNNATRFNGPCGGYDFDEDGILNEDLCEQFNLTCDRW